VWRTINQIFVHIAQKSLVSKSRFLMRGKTQGLQKKVRDKTLVKSTTQKAETITVDLRGD